ncbi:hypothetical protein CLAIMM_08625 [Cladophialophora immunda]|nr:hypothetical protein CLAIMM_08625 [Cladophialophora immunda]
MTATSQSRRHALILGASGITGWAIVNSLCEGYPELDAFDKITAVTNRPLTQQDSGWPSHPRLEIVSGIDLVKNDQESLNDLMRKRIPAVDTVSHLYFYAYKQDDDEEQECKINEMMLSRAVTAVETLSSELTYVVLPSGTKIYGVHMLDKFPFSDILPISESAPPLPEPWLSRLFYYNQIDCLKRMSHGKQWTWCEVRPDNIIGFVPNNNAYCLAQTLAIYLSLFRFVEGRGATCPFPGTDKSWKALYNESPQDMVARFSIYTSLHPSQTGGKSFNVAGEEASWSSKWPVVCSYFDLEGNPPVPDAPQPGAYIEKHRPQWDDLVQKESLKDQFFGNDLSHQGFQYFIMTMLDFDRHMDMGAMRSVGYTEIINTQECWRLAFDRMRKAKIIP